MDKQLIKSNSILIINSGLFLLSSMALYFAYLTYSNTFIKFGFVSGWILFLTLALHVLFNIRKMCAFLPVGSSYFWMQVHIYVGFFAVVAFFVHMQEHSSSGLIGLILQWLFYILIAGGVTGLIITRLMPYRLAIHQEEVIYERIPALREAIKKKIKDIIALSVISTESTSISSFHKQKLEKYLDGPKYFWLHILNSSRPYSRIRYEMEGFERYLNETEKDFFMQIRELVTLKTHLDYHYAVQTVLKYWLFLHIPFSYAIMAFSIIHLILVYAFSGDM